MTVFSSQFLEVAPPRLQVFRVRGCHFRCLLGSFDFAAAHRAAIQKVQCAPLMLVRRRNMISPLERPKTCANLMFATCLRMECKPGLEFAFDS